MIVIAILWLFIPFIILYDLQETLNKNEKKKGNKNEKRNN